MGGKKYDIDDPEYINSAMKEMGWNPDSEVPMANNENLQLIEDLKNLVREKEDASDEKEQILERVKKLASHTKNAEQSAEHNLKLLLAYQASGRTEKHLRLVAERERSKLKSDLKNADSELERLGSIQATCDKEINKRRKDVEVLANRIQWAKAAMAEWNQAMADGRKGFELIQKYFKEDEMRAKQQDLQRQKLQEKVEAKRAQLITMYDEQKALEQCLECTANLYRTAHSERRQMVETWKQAVQQMTQRERDISNGETELAELMYEADKKSEKQRFYDEKLNGILATNREIEANIEEINAASSEKREQIQITWDLIALKTNEYELKQKELQILSNKVQQQRAENRSIARQTEEKLKELNNFKAVLQKLEERYAQMENVNLSTQQRLQYLEDMADSEERTQSEINKATAKINELIFRAQQQLSKLKDDVKILELGNDGIRSTIPAIERNMQNAEKELRRQNELHYDASFKCLQLERKLIHLSGGVSDPEEAAKLEGYLSKLEEQYISVAKRLVVTEQQNSRLDDNMRKLTLIYNKELEEMETMSFKIKEAQVYCESGTKQLKEEINTNQTLIVELSILRLRIKELENEIARCEESSYNLDQHRNRLEQTIKERLTEIQAQMELLSQKRNHLNEEKAALKADIADRNMRIDSIKARFQLTSQLLGRNADGSLITATQMRVELVMEKQALLDEGNILNEKVLKFENEIVALENTLMLMNKSNEMYRNNVLGSKSEQDVDDLSKAEEDYCHNLERLKSLRSTILKKEKEINKMERRREELENILAALKNEW